MSEGMPFEASRGGLRYSVPDQLGQCDAVLAVDPRVRPQSLDQQVAVGTCFVLGEQAVLGDGVRDEFGRPFGWSGVRPRCPRSGTVPAASGSF
jgi:hypothetical protein